MDTPAEYDDIRAYEAKDLPAVYDLLLSDPQFQAVIARLFPGVPLEELKKKLYACSTPLQFQKTFLYSFVFDLMSRLTTGMELDSSTIDGDVWPCTFVSNHRDIVLDPSLLAALLVKNGFTDTPQIAIGDNLLAFPWIKHLVRLNKAFIVQRALGLRESLLASRKMSRYMHFVIRDKKESIWIAQREGRAKDSNDRTQDAVLKMIAMGGTGSPLESLREMNIVPVALSYEYDPCDYLKAKEFQQKRDNPEWKKSKDDDLRNMQTGIFGFKGHIHFQTALPVNSWLADYAEAGRELFERVARRMDKEIYAAYRLYPGNYAAADLLRQSTAHQAFYNKEELERFEAYIAGQIKKVDLPNPDVPYLRERLLTMYANPVFNHEAS